MSQSCLVCLGETAGDRYHERCLEALFGTRRLPELDLDLAKLHTVAFAMVGRVSLSGIQRKVSVGLDHERLTLQVALAGARYILKPQAGALPHLPENEHVTMRLARLMGLETPPCGLMALRDGSLAYVVTRFDRPPSGGKLHQEDFCQLAEKSPKEKYEGSAELCARLLRRYAGEPLVALLHLYRQFVFAWWTGNGDLHLKNLSLLVEASGPPRLSPAYDQLNTRLVIPNDHLALSIGGKKEGIKRKTWLEFAQYCGIPERAAARVLATPASIVAQACALIERSPLPESMGQDYKALLVERSGILTA